MPPNVPVKLAPQNSYFIPNVPPLAPTNQLLGQGKYCLGIDSTIPFISLMGGGSSQKMISWGEMIEVEKGQTVKVKNESFMRGDIVINSGHDFAAKPERISTPFLTTLSPNDYGIFGSTAQRSEFPADTRRCRRAYVKCQIETSVGGMIMAVVGRSNKHSFPAVDNQYPLLGPYGYINAFLVAPLSTISTIPLGYGMALSDIDLPMALTDKVDFIYGPNGFGGEVINSLFMYVLEY